MMFSQSFIDETFNLYKKEVKCWLSLLCVSHQSSSDEHNSD